MRYRPLGRTGIQISEVCLGTLLFGRWGNRDEDDSVSVIRAALDAGINAIDTADMYSGGESETTVGKAIAGRRDEVILATKVHFPMGAGPNSGGSSRRWITRACDDSLRRLGTDRIDLYQLHRPDSACDIDETLGVLSDLVHAGKVVNIGTSTFLPSQIVEAQWMAERRCRERFATEQCAYSLVARSAERDVLSTCARHRIGVLAWAPLGGGWLSGRYRRGGQAPATQRAKWEAKRYDLERLENTRRREAVYQLTDVADDLGVPLRHLALAFVLNHQAVSSVIIGPRSMEQLTTLLGAVDVELDDEVLDRIDAIVSPGMDFAIDDAGFIPPWIEDSRLRRRGVHVGSTKGVAAPWVEDARSRSIDGVKTSTL